MNKISKTGMFGFLALLGLCGWAEPETKTVGLIKTKDIEPYNLAAAGFKKSLKKANIDFKLMDANAAGSEKMDLIFAIGADAAEAANASTLNAPVVFSMVADPGKKSFDARRITGVSMEVAPKEFFQMLKSILPSAKKVGVLYDPKESRESVKKAAAQAKDLGMELVAVPVNSEQEAYHAIRSLGNQTDAFWMIADPTVCTLKSTKDILLFALKEKMPVIGFASQYTKAGALFSLSCDYKDIGEQSGAIAARLLNGESPENIPIAPCRKVSLSINLIVADRIGISIPQNVMVEASDVYQ